MKSFLTILAILFSTVMYAQSVLDASIVRLFLEDQHYVQLNTYFIGGMLPHSEISDSTKQAKVNLTLIFSKNDKIIKAVRYAVHGPITDTKKDFVFHEKIALDTGNYQLKLLVENPSDNSEIYAGSSSVQIEKMDDFKISDILPTTMVSNSGNNLSGLKLQGYYVEYLPFNFVPKNISELSYYYEIALPESPPEVLIRAETLYAINHDSKHDLGTRYKKIDLQNGQKIYPTFSSWNLEEVPSGDYYIEVNILDKEKNQLASSHYPFTHSNPTADASKLKENLSYKYLDTLDNERLEYLARATLISVPSQDVAMVNLFLENKNFKSLKNYLYNYWAGQSPGNPYGSMSEYMKLAQLVDDKYDSGFRYGFETDRGRVRMKYGQPNEMTGREQDMSSVPYEIWTYNRIESTGQTNVKFVFYNPSLVTNDMELIHSTAIGEIKNYKWERLIYSDVKDEFDGPNHIDANQMEDNINRNARRLYDNN